MTIRRRRNRPQIHRAGTGAGRHRDGMRTSRASRSGPIRVTLSFLARLRCAREAQLTEILNSALAAAAAASVSGFKGTVVGTAIGPTMATPVAPPVSQTVARAQWVI